MNMINKNDFVEIDFTARVKDGEIFDTSRKEDAEKAGLDKNKCELLNICLGQGMIVKGFDDSIEGKEIGKAYKIELNPEDAFGKREVQLVKTFPAKIFTSKGMMPQPGMMYSFDNAMARVVSVSGGRVIVDFNNPLSGKIIAYDFIIKRKIDDPKEKIIIDYSKLSYLSLNDLIESISHEVVHALDPKTRFQKTKDEYKKHKFGSPDYYKISPEFDAYGSQLEIVLKRDLTSKNPLSKHFIKGLKNWLRTGKIDKFVKYGLKGYLPILSAWQTDPYLWKKFRQKLFTTLTDIEEELDAEKK